MAGFGPFQAASGATVGKTVSLPTGATNTSVATTVNSTGGFNPCMLITNQGPNLAWVRMSTEASPTATAADIPMLGNTVRLFANPNPNGVTGVAVIVSVTTSANTLWFTPGQGGS